MNAGHRKNGIYVINPSTIPGRHFSVYCKFDRRAWTVIQRRVNGEVDFNKAWVEYKNGFGILNGSFWLGLRNMHDLTFGRGKTARLRIDLRSNSGVQGEKFSIYKTFAVGSESSNYRLHLESYLDSSTAGESLLISANGMKFTTIDNDNDHHRSNCAAFFSGGWWHRDCFHANLNGLYPPQGNFTYDCDDWANYAKYITWKSFDNCFGDIMYAEMKIA